MEQLQDFKLVISEIVRLIRKNHISYAQLKYVFSQARKQAELKQSGKSKGAKEHLSQEEAKRLINYAYESKGNQGLMLKVLLFTGARNNEFVNIELKDVYLAEKKIYLSTTKGDKPRYVPIFDFYGDELRTYINNLGRSTGYLFESNRHTHYSTRMIQIIIKGYITELGITKKITPHRLRATIATWLSEKGVSTEDIQKFLGHSKIETTQIYTQGAVRNLQEIGSKLLIEGKNNG